MWGETPVFFDNEEGVNTGQILPPIQILWSAIPKIFEERRIPRYIGSHPHTWLGPFDLRTVSESWNSYGLSSSNKEGRYHLPKYIEERN